MSFLESLAQSLAHLPALHLDSRRLGITLALLSTSAAKQRQAQDVALEYRNQGSNEAAAVRTENVCVELEFSDESVG